MEIDRLENKRKTRVFISFRIELRASVARWSFVGMERERGIWGFFVPGDFLELEDKLVYL